MEKPDDSLDKQLEGVNKEIELHKRQDELLELRSHPGPWLERSDPIIESPRKYGVFEEDAEELLGLLTGEPKDAKQTTSGAMPAESAITTESHPGTLPVHQFSSDGDVWAISYAGKTISLTHRIGLRYLQELIRNSRRGISVTQLVALNSLAGEPLDREARELDSENQDGERTISSIAYGDSAEDRLLDNEGLRALDKNIRETITALTEAEKRADEQEALRLNIKLDDLNTFRQKAVGRDGKPRPFPQSERPRTSVKKAIDRAIEKIEGKLPELANHLRDPRVLRTGSECIYLDTETAWLF